MLSETEHTFSLSEEGIKSIRKQAVMRALPLAIIATIVGLLISMLNHESESSGLVVYAFTIPIIGISMTVGLVIGSRRQQEIFARYRLMISKDGIIRSQANTPTIKLKW